MGSGYKLPYTAAEINKKLGDTDKCLPVLIDLDTYGETPINLILGSLFLQGGGGRENVDIGNLMDALLTDSPLRVQFTFGVNVLYAYGVCVGRVNNKAVQLNLNAMFTHQGKTYLAYASIDTPSADEAGKANIAMSVEEPGELQEAPVQSVNGQTGAVQLSAADVGALPSSELPAAINDALALAKESGAFDGNPGKDGVSATHSWDGTVLTVTSASGTSSADLKGAKGDKGDSIKGDPGADGVSPTVAVSKSGKATTISITDKNGTKTATINDGADGSPGSAGKDGTSVTHSWSGSTLTVTSASGTSSADLKGEKGDTGATGPKGDKGDTGDQGIQGEQGPKGDTGPAGADGAKGEKGDKGDQGIQGIQGEKGEKGDTGATGPKGDKGDKGDTGDPGPAYTLTPADKTEMVNSVKSALPTLTVTGVDADGTTHTWTMYGVAQ